MIWREFSTDFEHKTKHSESAEIKIFGDGDTHHVLSIANEYLPAHEHHKEFFSSELTLKDLEELRDMLDLYLME